MNTVLKNVINNTIDREFDNAMSDYQKLLDKYPEFIKKREEIAQNTARIEQELKALIPPDKHKLIMTLLDSVTAEMSIETRVAFKEGVVLGATGLSYLSEVGEEIQLL